MCGRGRCCLSNEQIAKAVPVPISGAQFQEQSNENLKPGDPCLVVSMDKALSKSIWGLVPSYTPSTDPVNHWMMYNARTETVSSKGAFKRLLQKNRCVIVWDGFYEWKEGEEGGKQPYYVHSSTPLVMAGLLDNHPSGLQTFIILTCDPCSALVSLHDRQPVFLDVETITQWLDPATDVARLLERFQSDSYREQFSPRLLIHPVTKKMSRADYTGVDCSVPIKLPPPAKKISSFFAPGTASATAPTTSPASPAARGSTSGAVSSGGTRSALGKHPRGDIEMSDATTAAAAINPTVTSGGEAGAGATTTAAAGATTSTGAGASPADSGGGDTTHDKKKQKVSSSIGRSVIIGKGTDTSKGTSKGTSKSTSASGTGRGGSPIQKKTRSVISYFQPKATAHESA